MNDLNIKSDNIKKELENLNDKSKNLSKINLENKNLSKINLINGHISNSNLSKCNFKDASLFGIDLNGSNLFKANFEGANLNNANLKKCNLLGVNLTNTKLKNVKWDDNFTVINEIEADLLIKKNDYENALIKYKEAEDIYRTLKISMQSQTLGYETGEFFIREMIVKRKQLNKLSARRLGSKIIEITTGYGERLKNIFITMLTIIVACMFFYGIEGVKYSDPIHGDRIISFFNEDINNYGILNTLGNLFYFSVVVYSTVGFGEIIPIGPIGKTVMILEGIIGGLVLAILIIALYKKSMDR